MSFSGVVKFGLSRQGKNIDKDNTPTEKLGVLESRELVLMFGAKGEEVTMLQKITYFVHFVVYCWCDENKGGCHWRRPLHGFG